MALYTRVTPRVQEGIDRTAGMRSEERMRRERRLLKEAESAERKKEFVDACVKRMGRPTDREAFREMLTALIENNAIPASLLTTVPQRSTKAGKTRFDQVYDACMFLAFPEYWPTTKDRAFGPDAPMAMRFWRALFPKEFGLSHVVLRACSFQEAFALACDYACRLSLRLHNRIPDDLSIRIQFVSESTASRMLDIRHAVRDRTRIASNLKGRKYSAKDIIGARLVAIGRKDGDNYSIFKYAEDKDLKRIAELRAEVRVSAVDVETFRPKEAPQPYDEP